MNNTQTEFSNSHGEPPTFIKWLMWIFHKHTWQNHPILAAIAVVFILGTAVVGIFTLKNHISGVQYSATHIQKPDQTKSEKGHIAKKDIQEQITLENLFKRDFNNLFRLNNTGFIKSLTTDGEKDTPVSTQLYLDFAGKSKFLGYYIPLSPNAYMACKTIPYIYKDTMKSLESQAVISGGIVTEFKMTEEKDLVFTGRIYIYHVNSFSHKQLADLEEFYESQGLSVAFRGPAYLMMMQQSENRQSSKK